MKKMDSGKLFNAIAVVCPIDGVSMGNLTDKNTWRVQLSPSATPQQVVAAQNVIDNFSQASSDKADADEAARKKALTDDPGTISFLQQLKSNPAQIDTFLANATLPQLRTVVGGIIKYLARSA